MTLIITKNEVNNREAYLKLATAFAAEACHDKGCRDMRVFIDDKEGDYVTFVSLWDSKDDFSAHCQGETFAKYIPQLSPYYVSGTDTFLSIVK
ncbi:MAG: Antibiotic biosynthesis monooxygenase [Herbinix sp.]|jgi:quinol monooxygenase YgiN|nr:Antibiotic biosynthesis monooxygenase [Herbinix sp.]